MQDEVYIALRLGGEGIWQIEIIGFDTINVEAAESHVSTMVERVRIDSISVQHALNMILDDAEGINVVLKEAEPWWPTSHDHMVPCLLPHELMVDPGTFLSESLHPMQLSKIQHAFQSALEGIRCRKGAYDMAIRMGCIALSSKHDQIKKTGQVFHKENLRKEIDGVTGLGVKKWYVFSLVFESLVTD